MWLTHSVVGTEEVAPLFIRLSICCAFISCQFAMVTILTIVITLSDSVFGDHGLV